MQYVNLPGCPSWDRSNTPGTAPPTLRITKLTARTIVAFARDSGPNTAGPELMSRARRTGPLTIVRTAKLLVLEIGPISPKRESATASTAAITTGRYSGRHPAITAL